MKQDTRGGTTPRFTALELATAEQLIHLSESSCSSSSAAFSFSPRGRGGAPAPSAASASSSPRSVNAPAHAVGAEDDEDGQEVGGRPRRNRRYRPIAEIYDVTEPAGGARSREDAKAAGAGGGKTARVEVACRRMGELHARGAPAV